ncbi:MAG: amidohydrolase family protein [Thermodesulfobacteriota bacterium]|nr:amidohydrolase family protein [Thermodesulfobacteriota bacterium]
MTIAPGLINSHNHLELSGARGRTAEGRGFEAWVRSLLPLLQESLDQDALDAAIAELSDCGTVFVGDITSRNPGPVTKGLDRAGLGYVLFVEFFGYAKGKDNGLDWPGCVRELPRNVWENHVTAAGHALYSTSPKTLQAAHAWCARRDRAFTLHLAEHPGEVELLTTGKGAFAEILAERVLPKDFTPPGMTPVAYADALNLLDDRTLAVHCVQLNDSDIKTLRTRRVNVCLCPRSNAFIGVGRAPWERLAHAGINLCLGTDSLGSNHDLNLWNEAECVLRGFKGALSLTDVLAWMTVNPAKALGLDQALGALTPGRRARYSVMPDALASFL